MTETPEVVDLDMFDTPAAERLSRIRHAVLAGMDRTDQGEPATPQALAQASADAVAEAEHQKLFAEGLAKRKRAERAAEKARLDAIAKVRANLPTPPAELDELEAKAYEAVDNLRAADAAYRQHIAEAKATLAAGGVVEWVDFVDQDGVIDPDNHGFAHRNDVMIDGTLYTSAAVSSRLHRVAERARPGGIHPVSQGIDRALYESRGGDL